MSSKYWSGVGKRLASFGKSILDKAVPVVVDAGITMTIAKACLVIEDKLKKMYIRTGINSAISFSFNLAGVLFLIFKPFENDVSKYVAYGFFIGSFIFWLVRTILFIKNYGKQTIGVSKSIVQQKSVYNGIEQYVLTEFPMISLVYAGINLASKRVPSLKDVPSVAELVAFLVEIFWKRVALFAGIVAVYTVTVFWVIKPLLLKRFA